MSKFPCPQKCYNLMGFDKFMSTKYEIDYDKCVKREAELLPWAR